ncbi:hypothetical protein PSEUBRA_003911 [Kalmanozyma brasiliensis GHG001]|uniref:Uncharacterized protein n=1 Tax=Kalmanozyma brasiliensis (strain GHG001) TaxID=1365824 RepID=V5ESW0_KALBG|nr:uncharacterized protein PSEUBRA_003911 [Kalmanozyma brasiliensis GHG001]EST06053.1 hypothetical protein PSEUBRA_003911 [Kalmanozyma brasiliensis GHG001]
MQRHDGLEYVPAIFGGQPPHAAEAIALVRFSQEQTTWNLPIMIAQTLLVGEIIRTYPAEFRMFHRLYQRKKPNMAEIFFVLIKYLTLTAVVCDILVMDTLAAKSDGQCRSWSWTASTLYFVCSSLVFCVIGWRARIVFRTSRLASYLLGAGLAVQFAIAMWTNYRVDKADAITPAGSCAPSTQVHGSSDGNPALTIRFWQSHTFWYLLYNCFFETIVLVACCLQLRRTSSGPGGLTRIAKVLFLNNVHYMVGVEACNVVQLIMLLGWTSSLPPVHVTSIAIQIVVGLQMLIGEQEAVYSPASSRVTYSSRTLTSSNGHCEKPRHGTSPSNVTFVSPGRSVSYVKRPDTATTGTDATFTTLPARKGTFSSFSSVPAYVKSCAEEEAPQVPPKSSVLVKEETRVSIEASPLYAHDGALP